MSESFMTKTHNFIMENRGKVVLTGIREVGSFDENVARLFTEVGDLIIKGKNLFVSRFSTDNGELELTGEIDSIHYGNSKERSPHNFITKLFK